ncbi:MAG: hypothetical protein ACOYI8_03590 [Christensenellales bacterium]|jgi:hypothetical protein
MYLDPGFGSMIVQFVIAAIAVCGGYLVIFRKKVAAFFRKNKKDASASESKPEGKE